MEIKLTLPAESNGLRLDHALCSQIPEFTRNQLQRLLRTGMVKVNDQLARAAQKVVAGQQVCLRLPPAEALELEPTPLPLDILYEDQHLIVINKALGVVVHPAPGHSQNTLVHGLLHHCRDLAGIGGKLRPGIVHRLDKDTSGALVAAKDDQTHQGLVKAFAEGQVEKEYLALVWGHPPRQGNITQPIGRHPVDRKRMSGRSKNGKPASSSWQTLNYYQGAISLLKVVIHTGRTHQIRVHLSEAGFPLLGDATYASKKARLELPGLSLKAPRQMLHAHKLNFIHPITGKKIETIAALPPDMAGLINQLEPLKICCQ